MHARSSVSVPVRLVGVLAVALLLASPAAPPAPAGAAHPVDAQSTATGWGGAVATFDALATQAGLEILRRGGNAVDATVAAAATLGVTDPYSAGVGGGGFLVAYLARSGEVVTIDHRETSPASMEADAFVDPATGRAYPYSERETSGLAVGVPGTVRGWETALRRYGTMPLLQVLTPAMRVARHGFVVDRTYAAQTELNLARFRDFPATAALFLTPSGEVPAVGSVVRNPDLAETYLAVALSGAEAFYDGAIAQDIVATVTAPPLREGATRTVRPGTMTHQDLRAYQPVERDATVVRYRGYEVYGMAPPSSGGSTDGEALNILEGFALAAMPAAQARHHQLEASRLAFADRNAYIADPAHVYVPLRGLLSQGFADERRDQVGDSAAPGPVPAGDPYPYDGSTVTAVAAAPGGVESSSTAHLTVADADGNVVSYTFTINDIGGSGMVVPGRGFLLNDELTDFDPLPPHHNAPAGGKRPRSSMSPTIVLRDGRPVLAVGAGGGATIITTVLQILVDSLDHGRNLPDALAAPRVSQRNTAVSLAEPGFLSSEERAELESLGHRFGSIREIGAATGLAFLEDGRVQAVAEPSRRGGGAAGVQHLRRS